MDQLLWCTIHEVCDGGATVCGDSRNWVLKECDHGWQYLLTIGLLELLSHVVTDLSNAMQCSISDLWILVLQVLHDNWYHGLDILDIINVLTNL